MEAFIMLQIRPATTLDGGDFGWLKARHHFKVAPDGNPANTPLGSLVVWNDDEIPHSFHVHGLRYGIDSDGAWPFGTEAAHGARSDAICPGETWIYTFDVTDEMLGAWPFLDHTVHTDLRVNQGLFGGLVVLGPCDKSPRRFEFREGMISVSQAPAGASKPSS